MVFFANIAGHPGSSSSSCTTSRGDNARGCTGGDIRPPCALRANGIDPMRSGTITNAYDPAGIASAVFASAAISPLNSSPLHPAFDRSSGQHQALPSSTRTTSQPPRATRARTERSGNATANATSPRVAYRRVPLRRWATSPSARTATPSPRRTPPPPPPAPDPRAASTRPPIPQRCPAGGRPRVNAAQRRFRHHARPPVGARRQRGQPLARQGAPCPARFPDRTGMDRRRSTSGTRNTRRRSRATATPRRSPREPRTRRSSCGSLRPARRHDQRRTDHGRFLAHEGERGGREAHDAVAIAPLAGSP